MSSASPSRGTERAPLGQEPLEQSSPGQEPLEQSSPSAVHLQRRRSLRVVRMLRARVDLELRQLLAAETRAREHPLDRLAEDLLRPPLELLAQRALLQPARVARMPVVHLLVELLPRH